jgi:excisionase family DNA binding protein
VTAEPQRRTRRAPLAIPLAATIDDTCGLTGLGRTKVYGLIREGKLRTVRIGRRHLVLCSSIERLLQPDT